MTFAERCAAARQTFFEGVVKKTVDQAPSSLRKPVATKIAEIADDVELRAEARSPKRSAEELETISALKISTEMKADLTTCAFDNDASETLRSEAINTWSVEDKELIDWFLSLSPEQLPTPPFKLYQHATVIGALFYEQLKKSIEAGCASSRARTGALQGDLKKLRELMNEKRIKTGVNVRQDDILDIEITTIKGDGNDH
jgi:hypothetical protein